MLFELKYPGFFLAAALILFYFAVKFYLSGDKLADKSRFFLFFLKYLFISLTLLFVFNPETVNTVSEERTEKHLLLFDNSRSVPLNDPSDSSAMKDHLAKALNEKSFITCTFGERTEIVSDPAQLNFRGNFTNISGQETNSMIDRLISENNIRSITLFTDGNFSDADNISLKNNIPVNIIYSTPKSPEPDIFISDLIYQDDPGETESKFFLAAGYKGEPQTDSFVIKIYEKGRLIRTVSHKIPAAGTFASVRIELPATQDDLREIEFVIEPIKNEKNLFNNKKTSYQRKPASSDNILVLSDTPSLDLAFLTRMLKAGGYNFKIVYENSASDSVLSLSYGSLIVMGSPGSSSGTKIIDFIKRSPAKLFMTNSKTDLLKLNNILNAGLISYRYVPSEGRLLENKTGESAFLLTRSSVPVLLNDMPEGIYNSTFFPDETKFKPLLLLSNSTKSKALYHFSKASESCIIFNFSSFWKLAFNDESDNFSRLIYNILDLLSADRSFERLKISSVKEEYYSGEKIIFKGKILDAKLEEVQNAEAELFIKENSLKTKLSYSNKEYSSEIFIAEPGQYSAEIKVRINGTDEMKKRVSFKIIENDLETQSLGADTLFIKNFVGARGGRMRPLDRSDELLDGLKDKKEIIKQTIRFNFTRNIYYFIILAIVFLIELAYRKYKDLS